MYFELFQTIVPSLTNTVISEIVLILGILLVLFIVFRVGKFLIGLLMNSILGIISIFVLDAVFGLGIPIKLLTIVASALFGLPAVAIMAVLRLFGVQL